MWTNSCEVFVRKDDNMSGKGGNVGEYDAVGKFGEKFCQT